MAAVAGRSAAGSQALGSYRAKQTSLTVWTNSLDSVASGYVNNAVSSHCSESITDSE